MLRYCRFGGCWYLRGLRCSRLWFKDETHRLSVGGIDRCLFRKRRQRIYALERIIKTLALAKSIHLQGDSNERFEA